MPKPSTIDCDIALTPDLRMRLFDAGISAGPFYRTQWGKVALVGVVGEFQHLVLAATPEEAIRKAEAEMFGGL